MGNAACWFKAPESNMRDIVIWVMFPVNQDTTICCNTLNLQWKINCWNSVKWRCPWIQIIIAGFKYTGKRKSVRNEQWLLKIPKKWCYYLLEKCLSRIKIIFAIIKYCTSEKYNRRVLTYSKYTLQVWFVYLDDCRDGYDGI